ncbi:MAG: DNA topoisomerase IV subunit B [Defluviicoccus sp.]
MKRSSSKTVTATATAAAGDLFASLDRPASSYSAHDIEVLEGLEPVRRRPAMFIGGTDERALHHLVAELLDNAMDEAVAGYANRIELELAADGWVSVRDNGRGIPVEPHPKFPDRTALEVILTTLHAGAKFGTKAYTVSGGLHGVGLSVVNALADQLIVEVARERTLWRQSYRRGAPEGPPTNLGPVANRRGTVVSFRPDATIFAEGLQFRPATLYRMARSKAYLYRGVEIRWACDPALLSGEDGIPAREAMRFPGGLRDFLTATLGDRAVLTPQPFFGEAAAGSQARVEWAIAWPADADGFCHSYCNTVPTPDGGTHEAGLRAAIAHGLRAHGQLIRNKAVDKVTAEDALGGACVLLSVFLAQPEFQGQTKERLTTPAAARLVETAVGDHFDHWLAQSPEAASELIAALIERADERIRRRQDRRTKRQSATRKLRLPGKLADCTREAAAGTELFIVEGDSAGGSAKQARNRDTQAVLPLRGKILNVASAASGRVQANQELTNLIEALGCGAGRAFRREDLRYEKAIIMTDADVDGAHIASLLLTFFFRELPGLVEHGHVYLAVPPLYRLSRGTTTLYARDDADKDRLLKEAFAGRGAVEISRFKGLGEMPADQLRNTTMDPTKRTLLRVVLPPEEAQAERADAEALIEALMGRRPERRFAFIVQRAPHFNELDI